MHHWNLWSGGPCESKYAGRDEPEHYHELEIRNVSWYWLFAEWLWDAVRDLLEHVKLPGRLGEEYGDLGGVMQCKGDALWQGIVTHTLGNTSGPRVRVSCAFFNASAVEGTEQCTCGYQPRAPERHPPTWRISSGNTTTYGGATTMLTVTCENDRSKGES